MAEQSILQKSDCAQLIHNYPLLVKCYQFGKGLEIRGAEVCTCARVSYFFLNMPPLQVSHPAAHSR